MPTYNRAEDTIDQKYGIVPRYRKRSSSYDRDDYEQPDFGTSALFIAYRELIERIVERYHHREKRASKPRPAIRLARIHALLGKNVNHAWTLYAIEKSRIVELVEGTYHVWVRLSEAARPVQHFTSNEELFIQSTVKRELERERRKQTATMTTVNLEGLK